MAACAAGAFGAGRQSGLLLPLGRVAYAGLPAAAVRFLLEAPAESRLGERPAPLAEQLGAVLTVEDAQIQLPLLIDQIDAALHPQQVGDGGSAGLLDFQLALRHLALQLDAIEGSVTLLHRLPELGRAEDWGRRLLEPLIQQRIYLHLVPERLGGIERNVSQQGAAPVPGVPPCSACRSALRSILPAKETGSGGSCPTAPDPVSRP